MHLRRRHKSKTAAPLDATMADHPPALNYRFLSDISRIEINFAIGIGRDFEAPPSHTTVHTVPYTAVRIVMLSSELLILVVRASRSRHLCLLQILSLTYFLHQLLD